jgi:4'-phosphopantetheinyl transferase EntD
LQILQGLGCDGIVVIEAHEGARQWDSSLVVRNDIRTSALLGRLFPGGVIAFEVRQLVGRDTLHVEEAPYVARAVPKRVGEFAAGRACARRALAELAIVDFPLRVGSNREPLWPEGITGSITHTTGFCGVVVARKTETLSLGVDAELASAVQRRLWRQIATAQESCWLEGLQTDRGAIMASVLFSAKEAFFKCQFPLTREWLNFGDVAVRVGRRNFHVTPNRTLALEALVPGPWVGRYALEGPLVVSGIALPRLVLANSTGRKRRTHR